MDIMYKDVADTFMTVKEAAVTFGVSDQAVRLALKEGRLDAFRKFGQWFVIRNGRTIGRRRKK